MRVASAPGSSLPRTPAPAAAHHFGTRKKLKTNCKSDTHDLSSGATARGDWRNAAASHIADREREAGGHIKLRTIILGKQASFKYRPQKPAVLTDKYPPQKPAILTDKYPPQKTAFLTDKYPPQKTAILTDKYPPQKPAVLTDKYPPQKPAVLTDV